MERTADTEIKVVHLRGASGPSCLASEILKVDESVLYLCLCFFSVGMYFRYTQRVDRAKHTQRSTPSLERECSAFLNSEK